MFILENVLSICDLEVFVGGVGVDVEVDVVDGIDWFGFFGRGDCKI